jgi:hypothetical protein
MRLRFDEPTFDYQTLRAATLRVFTEEEGAADHCQLGNLSLAHGVVYDWLDDAL